ncbi:hypothetical protein BKA67DRAFT_401157 [Truncatella angustata]|uniref:Uncharacterized protein n=1 Tax=Truncatella angustata TaxID=152316 RepID=A0A9P8RPP9_9PEZI|nr:uncharacterized protein BKA67DRAFT_401157 [Truncatella angustata]KAH6647928.1 hypothetical protein BKA67DRAFT_401157 [Truncatella angustata]
MRVVIYSSCPSRTTSGRQATGQALKAKPKAKIHTVGRRKLRDSTLRPPLYRHGLLPMESSSVMVGFGGTSSAEGGIKNDSDSDLDSEEEEEEVTRGPLGLQLLYSTPEPLIDVIFFHGLRGGSIKKWQKGNKQCSFWPKYWLPMAPDVRNINVHSF